MSVPEPSFNFDSALALSIEMEEQYGHLDCGEVGYGLFSSSPLTSPEPTPPPSPSHQPTPLDGLDLPSIRLPLPPDPQQMPRDSSAAVESPGGVKSAGRYCSNKMRSHAKRKREGANERMERKAGGLPYEVRAPTRLKHRGHRFYTTRHGSPMIIWQLARSRPGNFVGSMPHWPQLFLPSPFRH